ncbi:MAG: Ig-like domain-containing protein [Acetobacteraceae bacterium]|nr:Ig-like domain-containing protein [Acetobacteraceae bacterium]
MTEVSRVVHLPGPWRQWGVVPLVVTLALSVSLLPFPAQAQSGSLSPGAAAMVANTGGIGIRLRAYPSESAPILGRNYDGTQVKILEGPISADGYTWWRIQSPAGTGWGAGGAQWFAPLPRPAVCMYVTVTNTGGIGLRLRAYASESAPILGRNYDGTQVLILDGPVAADGYYWWKIQSPAGTGWSAGLAEWLVPVAAPPPADPPPTVVSTSPTANDTSAAVTDTITATFSEDIRLGTGSVSVTGPGGGSVPVRRTAASGRTLTVTLASPMTYSTGYAVLIRQGAVTDLAGNPNDSFSWTFATGAAPQAPPPPPVTPPPVTAPPPSSPPPASPPPSSSPPPVSAAPSLVLVEQFRSDGSRLDGLEPVTETPKVVLKGRVEYAGGGKVGFEVELRRQDEGDSAFTGTPTHWSVWSAAGSDISLSVSGLAAGTYHWQARAVTDQGAAGQWVTFGDNSESDADFYVLKSPDTSYGRVAELLEEAASDCGVPPMLLKAIAFAESGWLQIKDGKVCLHDEKDGRYGVGVMQVTVRPEDDYGYYHRLGWDLEFNIREGARILRGKWDESQRQNPPSVEDDLNLIENWWYATVWYRGHREDSVAYAAKVRGYVVGPPGHLRDYMSPMGWTLPGAVIPGFRLGDIFSARDNGAGQGAFITYDSKGKITGRYPAEVHRWSADGGSATGTAEPAADQGTVLQGREPGDVTGDGTVDLLDAMRILNIALGRATPSDQEREAADADGDGVVSVLDVVRVVKMALGGR